MSGLTGALFKEFAFTLASAVIISGVIALTLSPMMCSKILSEEATSGKFAIFLDEFFNKLKRVYQNALHSLLDTREMMLLLAGVVILMLPYLYSNTLLKLRLMKIKLLFCNGYCSTICNLRLHRSLYKAL